MSTKNYQIIFLLIWLSACSNNAQQTGKTNSSESPQPTPDHHFTIQAVNTLPITSAHIVDSGFMTCFPNNIVTTENLPVYCKTSAVAYYDNTLIFASDEPITGEQRSAVFTMQYTDHRLHALTYLTNSIFVNTMGYSDFALTPDGHYLIATTSFDRIKENSVEWNNYNSVLMWRTNDPNTVQIISPTTIENVTSSIGLRDKLAYSLGNDEYPNGIPYFKIEGLAVIPGNKLLFGVGEEGINYEDFEPVIKIIAVSYTIEEDTLLLADDFQVVYNHNPSTIAALKYPMALSGLEYDKYHDQLLILTRAVKTIPSDSLETLLWALPIRDLDAVKPASLLMNGDDKPLIFRNKAEDITLLDAYTAFVIHDDEFVLDIPTVDNGHIERYPNQAAYSVINLMADTTYTPLKIK